MLPDTYNNPYSSIIDVKKWKYYYYAYTKKLLSQDECIKYAECSKFRLENKNYRLKKPKPKQTIKPLTQDDYDIYYVNSIYNYDKEGIISMNDDYIFYKDKVYGKHHNKYIKIHCSKCNGNYCLVYSGHKDKTYKYKLTSTLFN